MSYKIILLDSGRVLNKPTSGHWMIPPKFFNTVNKDIFDKINKRRKNNAFRYAMKYIDSMSTMHDMAEEYEHFQEYYRLFFSQLPELNLSEEMIEDIAKDLVFNLDKYIFYEDALEIIPKLSKMYCLAVVSDAWPSLNHVFEHNDFLKYFEVFINSSLIGVRKPDALMYVSALKQSGYAASEAVFVDDRAKNCDGAKAVGIERTYLMSRNSLEYFYNRLVIRNHKVVRNLNMVFIDLAK
mgnify:CR=1 FL=1